MVIKGDFQLFLDGLEVSLLKLPLPSQLAFGAACCERHFSSYEMFSKLEQWGQPELLRVALETAWKICLGDASADISMLAELLDKCIAVIPDADDFSMPIANYAQNEAIMIVHLIEFMAKNNPKFLVMTASLARDTVDAKIQIDENFLISDPDIEIKIQSHPLMKTELAIQKIWLDMLSRIINVADMQEFKRNVDLMPISH